MDDGGLEGGSSAARNTDPETAHEAAAANPEKRSIQRTAVLRFLESCGERGATDYETSLALNILRTSAGKRRLELCELGKVAPLGMRRPTDTGSSALVWGYIADDNRAG